MTTRRAAPVRSIVLAPSIDRRIHRPANSPSSSSFLSRFCAARQRWIRAAWNGRCYHARITPKVMRYREAIVSFTIEDATVIVTIHLVAICWRTSYTFPIFCINYCNVNYHTLAIGYQTLSNGHQVSDYNYILSDGGGANFA